jgi:hypothetical protein
MAKAPKEQRVDWAKLLGDLKEEGMTFRAIKAATGIPVTTLHDYKAKGAEPRYADGTRLVALWHRKAARQLPVMPASERRARSKTGGEDGGN